MTTRVCTPDEHGMTVHTNRAVGFAKLQALQSPDLGFQVRDAVLGILVEGAEIALLHWVIPTEMAGLPAEVQVQNSAKSLAEKPFP